MAISARPAPPEPQDGEDALSAAWIAGLYSLHGPPGPSPALALPPRPAAPFVEPRTAEFRVPVCERSLEVLLSGCGPSASASPCQDVCQGGDEGGDDCGGDVSEWKWDVSAEEEVGAGAVRLHMHRSWTGIKLIELSLATPTCRPLPENAEAAPKDDEAHLANAMGGRTETDRGPSITHITFETHEDYKLKGADEGVYKRVALEVCWWVLGVCLDPEPEK